MAIAKAINVSQETYSRLKTQANSRGWSMDQFLDYLLQAVVENPSDYF